MAKGDKRHEVREGFLALLGDVAQSEHRIRHEAAFDALCAELGYKVDTSGSSVQVIDPSAEKKADAPAE